MDSSSTAKKFIKRHRRMDSVVIVHDDVQQADQGHGGARPRRPRIQVIPGAVEEEQVEVKPPPSKTTLPPSPPPRRMRQLIPWKLVDRVTVRKATSTKSASPPPVPPRRGRPTVPPPLPPRDTEVVQQVQEERPNLPQVMGRIPNVIELIIEIIMAIA